MATLLFALALLVACNPPRQRLVERSGKDAQLPALPAGR